MTANKTAEAIPRGPVKPDAPLGAAVAKGHPGGGAAGDGAKDGAGPVQDRALWFQQIWNMYGAEDMATFRRLEWEWQSNQWFLLLDDNQDVLGWISWYRCDFRTLALIRDRNLRGLLALGEAGELLTRGEYLYIPTVVSARPLGASPGSRHVLFALLSWARARNPDARIIAWHSLRRGQQFQVFSFHKLLGARHGD